MTYNIKFRQATKSVHYVLCRESNTDHLVTLRKGHFWKWDIELHFEHKETYQVGGRSLADAKRKANALIIKYEQGHNAEQFLRWSKEDWYYYLLYGIQNGSGPSYTIPQNTWDTIGGVGLVAKNEVKGWCETPDGKLHAFEGKKVISVRNQIDSFLLSYREGK